MIVSRTKWLLSLMDVEYVAHFAVFPFNNWKKGIPLEMVHFWAWSLIELC